jgi:hypothetical protein
MNYALGRREPENFDHVDKYPFGAVVTTTVSNVEISLRLPRWHKSHNQVQTNSCVGHGIVMERAITNARQVYLLSLIFPTKRYNPLFTWNKAKSIDYWPDTNPGDNNGTAVSSGYDACRQFGVEPVKGMRAGASIPYPIEPKPISKADGQLTNRWATSVDQMRTAISMRQAVTIGTNWYNQMFYPTERANGEWWLGDVVSGAPDGHCTCIYGASDKRQAFRLKNSWEAWPEVWISYALMQRLLSENGEAALITDK